MTQHQRILSYLDDHGSISPMEAFTELGITKLSTRVGELIRSGHKIIKNKACGTNRYGETQYYMRYKKAV